MALKKIVIIAVLSISSVALAGVDSPHKGGNWLKKEHGLKAGMPGASCTDCHKDSWCSDCHNKRQELLPETKNPEAVDRTFTHRADYRTRHAGEAKTNPAQCIRCHTTESCQSCHTREGLNIGAANYPHPAGWMVQGSSQFHGRVARQDIVLCASCHERGTATNCITCHSTGATTTSPHPAGWKSNLNQSDPMCQRCH